MKYAHNGISLARDPGGLIEALIRLTENIFSVAAGQVELQGMRDIQPSSVAVNPTLKYDQQVSGRQLGRPAN